MLNQEELVEIFETFTRDEKRDCEVEARKKIGGEIRTIHDKFTQKRIFNKAEIFGLNFMFDELYHEKYQESLKSKEVPEPPVLL